MRKPSRRYQCLGPTCQRNATTKAIFCGRCWHQLPAEHRQRLEAHHNAGHSLYVGYTVATYLQAVRGALRVLATQHANT